MTRKSYRDACKLAAKMEPEYSYAAIAQELMRQRCATASGTARWNYHSVKRAISDNAAELKNGKPREAKRVTSTAELRWEDVPEQIRAEIKADIVARLAVGK